MSYRSKRGVFSSGAGFTFVEVVVGITILGLVAGSILYGLNQLNYFATVNRLYTAAQTLAQNQIDLILTKGPFDPTQSKYPLLNSTDSTSNILRTDVGTYYSDPSTPTKLYTTARDVAIYTDPMSNNAIVYGTIASSISDAGVSISGTSLNIRKATVTVSFTLRKNRNVFNNGTYTVTMNTMRAPDQ